MNAISTARSLIAALDVHHVAALLVQAGREILLPLFHQQDFVQSRKSDFSIVTEADTRCQQLLQDQLEAWAKSASPNHSIGFLGEEMTEEQQRVCLASHETFWCIDPLDGTGNFSSSIPLFAISLALIHRGKPIMAWIHDPSREETFTATVGGGLCVNGCRVPHPPTRQTLAEATGFLDFKRLPVGMVNHWTTPNLYRSQRNLGSCAIEWAWLACGRGAFIVHGKQKLWDYAAGVLLCEESACKVSDFHGGHPFDTARLHCSIAAGNSEILHQSLLTS